MTLDSCLWRLWWKKIRCLETNRDWFRLKIQTLRTIGPLKRCNPTTGSSRKEWLWSRKWRALLRRFTVNSGMSRAQVRVQTLTPWTLTKGVTKRRRARRRLQPRKNLLSKNPPVRPLPKLKLKRFLRKNQKINLSPPTIVKSIPKTSKKSSKRLANL